MNYTDFKKALNPFTVFSINDIKAIDEKFHRRRLIEWQDKGYIKKIIKGYYIFLDKEISEYELFQIANRIYSPSYISLETALSFYSLIPESVYTITSVSTKKTNIFDTPIARFNYRTIHPDFFCGYNIVEKGGSHIKIASVEKTIFDFLYLNPHIKDRTSFDSLRINKDILLKSLNTEKFDRYHEVFKKKSLTKRIKGFMEFIKYD